MAFPTVPTTTNGRVAGLNQLNTTATLTGPDLSTLTKSAGDLLIAIAGEYQSTATTGAGWTSWAGGGLTWTEIVDGGTGGTGNGRIGIAVARSVTGSETGTVTVTRSGTLTGDASMIVLCVPGAHATSNPEATAQVSANAAAADPAALSPSWGAEDTLWIGVNGNGMTSGTGSWTANNTAPTNYTDFFGTNPSDTSTVGDFGLAVAFRQLNASSEDMGTFGQDTSNARSDALLIAVRPAATPLAATGAATATPAAAGDLSVISAGGGSVPVSHTATGDFTTATNASTATLTANKPTNVADGDLLAALMYFRNATVQPTAAAGGWTFCTTSVATHTGFAIAFRAIPSAAGESASSYTFNGNASGRGALLIWRITGADLSTPIGAEGGANNTATGSNPQSLLLGSITTPSANNLLLSPTAVNIASATLVGISPASGMTEDANAELGISSSSSSTIEFAHEDRATAGATGTRTPTFSPDGSSHAGFLISIQPAAGGSTLAAAGAATTTPAATGALTLTGAVSGAAAVSPAAAGALTLTGAVTGAATTSPAAAGSLIRVTPLTGAATVSPAAAGALTLTGAVVGAATASPSASGVLTLVGGGTTFAVAGAATTTPAAAGALVTAYGVTGAATTTPAAAGGITATLAVIVDLGTFGDSGFGTSPFGGPYTTPIAAGALTLVGAVVPDTGAVTTPTAAGDLTVISPQGVSGAAAASPVAAGALTLTSVVVGAATTTPVAAGELTPLGVLPVSGAAAASPAAAGALTLRGAVTGAASATATASGSLVLRIVISGAAATSPAAAGALGVPYVVTGAAAASPAAAGSLIRISYLTGAALAIAQAAADLTLVAAPPFTAGRMAAATAPTSSMALATAAVARMDAASAATAAMTPA